MVFHIARRERVFERDIFRFGTGTVVVLNLLRFYGELQQNCRCYGRKYRLFIGFAKIELFKA